MAAAGTPEWIVREDASLPVLVALYLRQVLGIRFPEELPHLRGIPPTARAEMGEYDDRPAIEREWRAYWDLTVEPQANPSPVPLELIDGFDTYVALPVEGFTELQAAIAPTARMRWRTRDPRTAATVPASAAGRHTGPTRARSPSTSGWWGAARTRSS